MGSIEVFPPSSSNTPLIRIIIPELEAQHTLINTSNIQVDPLVNSPNIVVDDIGDITMELGVGPHKVTNTSAPKVVHLSPLNSIKGDSNFDHAPIS
jgi:hypothetical protein